MMLPHNTCHLKPAPSAEPPAHRTLATCTRIAFLTAAGLMLGSLLNCGKEPTGPKWSDLDGGHFELRYQVQDQGLSLLLVREEYADSLLIESQELAYRDYSGTHTSTLPQRAHNFIFAEPCDSLCENLGYNEEIIKGTIGTLTSFDIKFKTKTDTVVLFGCSDTSRPNGLTFNSAGLAQAAYLRELPGCDVWFVVQDAGDTFFLVSPSLIEGGTVWGASVNYSVLTAQNFASLSTCPATSDAGWFTANQLIAGETYGLWRTFGAKSWNITDHFAKLKVISAQDSVVAIVAYQPERGLRWVVTH